REEDADSPARRRRAAGPPRSVEDHGEAVLMSPAGSREQMKERPPSRFEALGLARPQLRIAPDHVVAVDEPPHERRSPPPPITEPPDFSKAKTRQAHDATGIEQPGRSRGVVPRQDVPLGDAELHEIRGFSYQPRDRERHHQLAGSLHSGSPGDQTHESPLQ